MKIRWVEEEDGDLDEGIATEVEYVISIVQLRSRMMGEWIGGSSRTLENNFFWSGVSANQCLSKTLQRMLPGKLAFKRGVRRPPIHGL